MQVHGDVFRPPVHPSWLAVFVGSGVQLLSMTVITMLFALLGEPPPGVLLGCWPAICLGLGCWVVMMSVLSVAGPPPALIGQNAQHLGQAACSLFAPATCALTLLHLPCRLPVPRQPRRADDGHAAAVCFHGRICRLLLGAALQALQGAGREGGGWGDAGEGSPSRQTGRAGGSK